MKYYRGFVLFELLLYALCLGLFAYVFSVMMYQLYRTILIQNKKREQLLVLNMAGDIFRRDIHEAPFGGPQWKEREDRSIIWHTAYGDIGWGQEGDRLMRITGHYSRRKHEWSNHTKNVIAQHIKEIHFQVEGHEKINTVVLHMVAEYVFLEVPVVPCARRVP